MQDLRYLAFIPQKNGDFCISFQGSLTDICCLGYFITNKYWGPGDQRGWYYWQFSMLDSTTFSSWRVWCVLHMWQYQWVHTTELHGFLWAERTYPLWTKGTGWHAGAWLQKTHVQTWQIPPWPSYGIKQSKIKVIRIGCVKLLDWRIKISCKTLPCGLSQDYHKSNLGHAQTLGSSTWSNPQPLHCSQINDALMFQRISDYLF